MMKKIIYSPLFWGFLFFAIIVKACDSISDDICGNEIYKQSQSPDGKFIALAFSRDCGATTGLSTQISIIPVGDNLENEPGNIFITDSPPKIVKPTMSWQPDAKTLQINFIKQGEIFKANNRYGEHIAISYGEDGS